MKKLLATMLALVMALGLCSVSWADAPEVNKGYKDSGNDYAALPEAPDMSGSVVNVTATNAQYTLDGAYGSIDDKTINFTESISNVLVLGRPTKYAGSNTAYFVGGFTGDENEYKSFETAAELVAHKNSDTWTPECFYNRTISNVKFTANANVTLAGFSLKGASGHIHGNGEADRVYDYVRDSGTWCTDNNNGYFAVLTMKNVTFDGLTVNSSNGYAFEFNTTTVTGRQNVVQGITFKNCKMTSSANGILHILNNGGTADVFSDITLTDNCELTVSGSSAEHTFGVYVQGVGNLKVDNCKLTGMTRAVQSVSSGGDNSQQPYGTLTVTNNTFSGVKSYIIRGESTTDLAGLTITGNKSENSGDSCKVKIGGDSDGKYMGTGTTAIYGNDWDEKVSNPNEWSKDTAAPTPSTGGYYYYDPTTDTKADEAKGSPKTFDAGVGIYAVTAALSVTGMAWAGKKRH